jgi:hypothetical protein
LGVEVLQLYRLALSIHVLAGITGLAAFWTPALARKGGATHVQFGRVFYNATCVVALTGLAMVAMIVAAPSPGHPRVLAFFLAYLVIITFAPVHHGVRVLETRGEPARLRTPFHTALNAGAIVAALAMIALAVFTGQPVFAALSPIGILVGLGNLGFARRPCESPMSWWYEHMGSMLGGGIAFHTAFLVIGAGRFLGAHLTGGAAVIPWVLPSIIGIPATRIWIAYYRRKFEHRGAGSGVRDPIHGLDDSRISDTRFVVSE